MICLTHSNFLFCSRQSCISRHWKNNSMVVTPCLVYLGLSKGSLRDKENKGQVRRPQWVGLLMDRLRCISSQLLDNTSFLKLRMSWSLRGNCPSPGMAAAIAAIAVTSVLCSLKRAEDKVSTSLVRLLSDWNAADTIVSKMVRATHNVTKYGVMVEGWKNVAGEATVVLSDDGVQAFYWYNCSDVHEVCRQCIIAMQSLNSN